MRAGLKWLAVISAMLILSLALAGCQGGGIDDLFPKAEKPVPDRLIQKMKAKDMPLSSPILLRIFKTENVLEVWKARRNGRYDLLETYEICKWSGKLGPKFKEGDRQAPEGFYSVYKYQMNPKSDYHLSFNIGYPNVYDRVHGRTGTHLMVHGACSSAGCYSMTDERVEEIYALAREAFKGGQDYFQVQAYPFRMTAENMAKHVSSEHFDFWKMLKEGYDFFQITRAQPKVDVCEKRYVFNRVAEGEKAFSPAKECPSVTMPRSLLAAYTEYREKDTADFRKALLREKARAGLKGEDASVFDPDRVTLVAAGSEVLPPPTPEPAAVASGTIAGVDVSAAIEQAPGNAGSGDNVPAATGPVAGLTDGVTGSGDVPVDGSAKGQTAVLPETVPVPVPAPREAALPALQPVRKKLPSQPDR